LETSNGSAAEVEQLLSEQLREMTMVLDEFDKKFSKKEKQLETARHQNTQLKHAFDQMKQLQKQMQSDNDQTRRELMLCQETI
jgi:methylthioribose-1-phosphate isomerase